MSFLVHDCNHSRHVMPAVPQLVCLVLWFLPVAGPAAAQPPKDDGRPTNAAETFTVPLNKLMVEPQPITLRSDHDDEDLFVPLSERLLVEKASMRLVFDNSVALRGERSQLLVFANGAVVAQAPLQGKQPHVKIEVSVPPEMLVPGFNRLRFEAAQHYTFDCEEDPGAPELWTHIDTAKSSISFRGRLQPLSPRLSGLARYISPALGNPQRYRIVTAANLRPAQLEIGALVSQAVGLRLGYRPGIFDHLVARPAPSHERRRHALGGLDQRNLAGTDSILIGTRDELVPFLDGATARAITGPYLGVYAQADDPRYLILLVSGLTDAEVKEAATVLTLINFPFADEAASRVSLLQMPSRVNLGLKHEVEPGRGYTLRDLGYRTTSLKGGRPQAIAIEFHLPPDFYVPESADVRLGLNVTYGATLRRDSVLNVYLNKRFERVIPLDSPTGAVLRDYVIFIPLRSFKSGRNVIEIEALMVPSVTEKCFTAKSNNLLLTLFDTTSIEFPEAGSYAEQPDLELFADTGFPYVDQRRPQPLVFALSSLDGDVAAAAWTLAGKLAQLNDGPLLHASFIVGLPQQPAHLIVIGPLGALDKRLVAASPFGAASDKGDAGMNGLEVPYPIKTTTGQPSKSKWDGLWEQVLLIFKGPQPPNPLPPQVRIRQTALPQRSGLALAFESPLAGNHLVTLWTASDVSLLKRRVEEIVQPERWGQLLGDLALWDDGETVFWQRASKAFFIGNLALTDRLSYHLSRHQAYWVGGVFLILLLLAWLTRRLLIRQGRKSHGEHQISED